MKTKLDFLAIFIASTNFLFAQEIEPFVCGTIEDDLNATSFSPFNNSAYSGSVDPDYLAILKTLDLSNYSYGLYKLILVVDGQISDTQTLIKN